MMCHRDQVVHARRALQGGVARLGGGAEPLPSLPAVRGRVNGTLALVEDSRGNGNYALSSEQLAMS